MMIVVYVMCNISEGSTTLCPRVWTGLVTGCNRMNVMVREFVDNQIL